MCLRLIGTFGPKSAPQTLTILLGLSQLIDVGNRTIVIVLDGERPIPTPAQYVPACESLSACQARSRVPWTISSSKRRTPFSRQYIFERPAPQNADCGKHPTHIRHPRTSANRCPN